MQREIKKYLFDISTSIESIEGFFADQWDFEFYQTNRMLRRAVERELEIIGEATNRILRIEPDINIPNARRIVNLRNWVIHSYDNVDDVIIWGILLRDIPKLKIQIRILLS